MNSIEQSTEKIKEAYHELSKAVGGFSDSQKEKILTICFENMWENNGYDKKEIEYIELFKRLGKNF